MNLRRRGKALVFLAVVAIFAWPGQQVVAWAIASMQTSEQIVERKEASGDDPSTVSIGPVPTPTPTPTSTATPKAVPTLVPTPTTTSTAIPKAIPTPTPTLEFPGGSPLLVTQIEQWIIRFTNKERVAAGLDPFEHDTAISDIARDHSEQMVLHGLRHTIAGKDPTGRALEAGYDCRAYHGDGSYSYGLSENIAEHPRVSLWTGTSSGWSGYRWRPTLYYANTEEAAHSIVQGWMDSPRHRANILDRDSQRIGVGVAVKLSTERGWTVETFYATQNFSSCR